MLCNINVGGGISGIQGTESKSHVDFLFKQCQVTGTRPLSRFGLFINTKMTIDNIRCFDKK